MKSDRMLQLAGVLLTEKTDSEQTFPIASITRKDIAGILNHAIDNNGHDLEYFDDRDPRLTNKVCSGFCQHMSNWHENFYDRWNNDDDLNRLGDGFLKEIGHGSLRSPPKKKSPAKTAATATKK